ncbi:MAG TPA: metal ABC transporter ATP-binding protein [Methanomassiliicoccales archaeon]|jgi:zinc transport system ATP-binding protein|nr:metal ABC transporter ATP-binding protein [Methanomassiliicoccales archaeon]
MSEQEKIIEIRNLTVTRSNSKVIESANLTVEKADYVGICGPNGGGKTTLLLSMLGVLPRQEGNISLFGQDIDEFRDWNRIAFVSQNAINFDLHFPMTVREMVGLGKVSGRNLGRRLKQEDWDKVDQSMEFMGITPLADRRIGQLSGGEKQRMFVAKALVRNPELVLLDEPLSGVDAETTEQFYKLLSNLNLKNDTTIIVVSHDLTAVFCRMNKVICVNRHVHSATITPDLDAEGLLKKAYGEHFHFAFHEHECKGAFRNV